MIEGNIQHNIVAKDVNILKTEIKEETQSIRPAEACGKVV